MNNFSSSSSQDYTQLKHQTYKDDLDEVEAIYGGFWQDAECHLQSNNVDRIAASLCKPHNDENEEQDDDIEEEEEDRANGVAENYKQFIDIPVSERERIYIHIFNRDYGLFHNVFDKYLPDKRREFLKLKDVPEYHLVDTLPKVCEALNLRMKKMNKNGIKLIKMLTEQEKEENTRIKEEKKRLRRLQGGYKEKPESYYKNYYYQKYAKKKKVDRVVPEGIH